MSDELINMLFGKVEAPRSTSLIVTTWTDHLKWSPLFIMGDFLYLMKAAELLSVTGNLYQKR